MRTTADKVLEREALARAARRERDAGKTIVFTNGCFDLIHVGHLRYLQAARELGDVLVVAANSDASIRRLKGEGRPVLPEGQRLRVLAALECVDYVTSFEEDTPEALLDLLRPEVLVKGANYSIDGVVGRDFVESYGGQVRTVALTEGQSTTGLVDRARSADARP